MLDKEEGFDDFSSLNDSGIDISDFSSLNDSGIETDELLEASSGSVSIDDAESLEECSCIVATFAFISGVSGSDSIDDPESLELAPPFPSVSLSSSSSSLPSS